MKDDPISKAVEANPGVEPAALAESIYPELGREELLPLVAARIEQVQRAAVREIETRVRAAVMTPAFLAGLQALPPNGTSEGFAPLFRHSFALGDGRLISWGRATVADHRARVAMLAATAQGIYETIALHERAIQEIESAGVSCLDEIAAVPA